MLKKLLLLVLVVVLFAAPFVGRWLYHYEGQYQPGAVPRPDLSAIEQPAPEIEPFADQPAALAPGVVVVDLSHENRVRMTELNLLQARLSARGQQLAAADSFDDLQQMLRYARALIVVSPGTDWTADEVEVIRSFVDKGGRLLLITDPTRFVVDFDEYDYLVFDYDSPHMNTLASEFGLIFQSDYLYNTVDNEGNFRNIRLTDFGDDPLTAGLKQVVFYATHSIETKEPVLITARGETRSSASQRTDPLPVAALAADGQVLALGDLIFLTEPYNAAYDNDRFVAHIADFLGGASRTYELADFPYFFGEQVDLVYVGEPLLDSDLVSSSGKLQELFAQADKELVVQEADSETQDTLLLGLYEEAEEAEPYLAGAQVTLLITPTETTEEPESPAEKPAPAPAATETLTTTPGMTPTLEISVTTETEVTPTVEMSPTHKNHIAIESVGDMVLTGTSLLLLQNEGERDVLLVLAHTETGLENAVERLGSGDLEDCLVQETTTPTPTVLALCPTGEVEAGQGGGGWQEPEPKPSPPPAIPTPKPPVTGTETVTPTVEPPAEPEGAILVVAVDKGEGRYDSMTGAADWKAILQTRYDVTVWSLAEDGPPDSDAILEYDLVVWDFGDFDADAAMDEISDALFAVMFGEIPFVMSGAFAGSSDTVAVQRDLQISDASHPVAKGFTDGEVISFVPSPSGSEYAIGVIEGVDEPGYNVVMVRGPDSEEAGNPSLVVAEDEMSGLRLGIVGFPIYLLPEEAKSRLVTNLVDWLLNP
jgi:hypothetical protein